MINPVKAAIATNIELAIDSIEERIHNTGHQAEADEYRVGLTGTGVEIHHTDRTSTCRQVTSMFLKASIGVSGRRLEGVSFMQATSFGAEDQVSDFEGEVPMLSVWELARTARLVRKAKKAISSPDPGQDLPVTFC